MRRLLRGLPLLLPRRRRGRRRSSNTVRLLPTTASSCTSAIGGQIQYTHTSSSTKDVLQVCRQDATGTYAWQDLIPITTFPAIPSGAVTLIGLELDATKWTVSIDPSITGGAAGGSYTLTDHNNDITGAPNALKLLVANPSPAVSAGVNALVHMPIPLGYNNLSGSTVTATSGVATVNGPFPTITASGITVTGINGTTTSGTITAVQLYDNGSLVASNTTGAALSYTGSALTGSHFYSVKVFASNGDSASADYGTVNYGVMLLANVTDIAIDYHVYIPDLSGTQCDEGDPDLLRFGLATLVSYQMCPVGTTAGLLSIWDSSGGRSGADGWTPTDSADALVVGDNHIQMHASFNQVQGTATYRDLCFNGKCDISNGHIPYRGEYSTALYGTGATGNVQWQLDLRAAATSQARYITNYTVSLWHS